VVRLPFL
jgi:hypothetical protein